MYTLTMTNPLCKYMDSLGKPNEGIHSRRFVGVAIMDVIMTLIVAWIVAYFTNKSFFIVSIVFFLMGIVLHRVFCVKTTVDKLLFGWLDNE